MENLQQGTRNLIHGLCWTLVSVNDLVLGYEHHPCEVCLRYYDENI